MDDYRPEEDREHPYRTQLNTPYGFLISDYYLGLPHLKDKPEEIIEHRRALFGRRPEPAE